MNRNASTIAAVFLSAGLLGCGSDKMTSPPLSLAGNYVATEWVTTGSSGQTNQLLGGSGLGLALQEDGTVTGDLHLAASGGNPAVDYDMAGTWTKSGNTLTFTQAADTFVRDMTFNIVPNGTRWSLTADQVIGSTRIQITIDQILVIPA